MVFNEHHLTQNTFPNLFHLQIISAFLREYVLQVFSQYCTIP